MPKWVVSVQRAVVIVDRSFSQERYYELVTDYATFQQRCRTFFAFVLTRLFYRQRNRDTENSAPWVETIPAMKIHDCSPLPFTDNRIILTFCLPRGTKLKRSFDNGSWYIFEVISRRKLAEMEEPAGWSSTAVGFTTLLYSIPRFQVVCEVSRRSIDLSDVPNAG